MMFGSKTRNERYRLLLNAGTSDTYWNDVGFLTDSDGSDGDTTLTDLSSNAQDATFVGDAQIDTDIEGPFDSTSLLFDGVGDYITFPANNDFNFGSGDFTVELHVYREVTTAYRTLISSWTTAGNQKAWALVLDLNLIKWHTSTTGADVATDQQSVVTDADTWYHFAVTRESGVLRFFVDGTQIGANIADASTYHSSTGVLELGGIDGGSLFHGNLDNIRITKGVARYVEDFTAPTEDYPTS